MIFSICPGRKKQNKGLYIFEKVVFGMAQVEKLESLVSK